MIRHYTFIDQCLMQLEQALRTPHATERTYPAADVEQPALSVPESRHAAGLMRVNHTGEICAQALYQGQALTAREPQIRETMQTAAAEEIDHLNWCRQRLTELNSHTSYLNPLWYIGSLAMGIAAGIAGDKWSLGFLAETERQVSQHLQGHLEKLPAADQRSRAIVEQMNIDEQQHAHTAIEAGAAELPALIKIAMKGLSKVMTTIAYRI